MTWVDAVARYTRLVVSVPRRYGLTGQDVDDVLQSTWETAFSKRASPPPADEFVPWIVAIAHWTTRGMLRDRRRRPHLLARMDHVPDQPGDVADLVAQAEAEQAVRDVLDSLRERDRALLTELFLADVPLSYDEVARMLGVADGSMGPLRARALARLQRAMRGRGFFG